MIISLTAGTAQEKANQAAADALLEGVAAEGGDDAPAADDAEAQALAAEMEMMKAMGLPGLFDTTAGKKMEDDGECQRPIRCLLPASYSAFVAAIADGGCGLSGSDYSCANISKKRDYRQYMNRRGGFNRPLDEMK